MLTLLFVDHPVVRLPHVPACLSTPAARISNAAPGPFDHGSSTSSTACVVHRVTLVMELQQGSPLPRFVGSDTSASATHGTDTRDCHGEAIPLIQCVARGSWGTCLTMLIHSVTTAASQDEDDEEEEELKVAPHPGALPRGAGNGTADDGTTARPTSPGTSEEQAMGALLSNTEAARGLNSRITGKSSHVAVTVSCCTC
jgi:hypothetical protein